MATKKAVKAIGQAAAERLVAEAAVLNREVKEKAAEIALRKVGIREYALNVNNVRPPEERGEKVEIESREGTATISFPKEKAVLAEGANPRTLKSVLSAETWTNLFAEEVVLADGFDAKLKLLSAEEQQHVRGLIEWKQPEPSVNLPK